MKKKQVCILGLTQWNLFSFEFKFEDTRLSTYIIYKDKIGAISIYLNWVLTLLHWIYF